MLLESILPKACIKKRRGSIQVVVEGKGFSRGEINKAGVSLDEIRKFRIKIDLRRKSTHQHNIDELENWSKRRDKNLENNIHAKKKHKKVDMQKDIVSRRKTSTDKKRRTIKTKEPTGTKTKKKVS